MKDKKVCEGCKYYKKHNTNPYFVGICDFLDMTGKSRIAIEMQNGGTKHDSCVCYEAKKDKNAVGWKWKKY
jgi:hypothetical protein